MSKPINILHLTDLHYTRRRKFNQKVILDALIEDLKTESDKVGSPDLIMFTGDLVNDADEEDIYNFLFDDFLAELLTVCNCDDSSIIFTPGNHDIHRAIVRSEKHTQDKIRNELNSRDSLNNAYITGTIFDLVEKKFAAFREFESSFARRDVVHRDPITVLYDWPEKNLAILSLNTAWAGFAGLYEESDLRQLLLPEASLQEHIAKIPAGRMVLCAHHHPTEWLAEGCERDFKDTLDGKIHVQLFGHMHDPRPYTKITPRGPAFISQSGALFTSREDRYIGYSVLRLETSEGHAQLRLRSYYDSRRQFDEATNIDANKGLIYDSEASRKFFDSLVDVGSLSRLKNWVREDVLPFLRDEFDKGMVEKSLCDLFVPPPLKRFTIKHESHNGGLDELLPEIVSFEDAISMKENLLINGYQEYGKTTLLQQMALHTIAQSSVEKLRHFIPVFIRFSEIRPGKARVEKAIRDSLPALPSGLSVERLLSIGAFAVFIDDVDFANARNLNILKQFVSENKSNRFVMSTPRSRYDSVARIDTGLPIHVLQLSIDQFRRGDVRALVRKFEQDEPRGQEEELLNRVIRELRGINVPVTPINSSLLLDIISNDLNFSPINRPALIERFIETLLKKRSLGDLERKKFDFVNRVDYLSYIAMYMCESNQYVFEYDKLVELTGTYLDEFGFNFSVTQIINDCIDCRIFVERYENRISFRFRAFLEFFTACRMRSDRNFYSWILEPNRYLSFVNELEYYAGLNRNDLNLLETIAERHNALIEEVFDDKFDIVLEWSDDYTIPASAEENRRYAEELAEQLSSRPMSEAERDELLDTEIPRDSEGRQEVFRPIPEDVGARYILSLICYTTVLKNSELVSDAKKREHLTEVLRSWSFSVLASFLMVPSLAEKRKMTINGISYEINAPREYSDERVARLIFLNLPKEIGRLIHLFLGTEKLERQLAETSLEEKYEPRMIKLFKSLLYIDLRLKEWWKVPQEFCDGVRDNRFFGEVMLTKIAEVYRIGSFSRELDVHLVDRIVDIYASLYGKDKESVERIRSKKKASLQRERNIFLLKSKIEKDVEKK